MGARANETLTETAVLSDIDEELKLIDGKVIIFGYSMGGFLSIKYLATLSNFDKIRALVFGGCCWSGTSGIMVLRLAGAGYHVMSRKQTWAMIEIFFGVGKDESKICHEEFEWMKTCGFFFNSWPQCVDVMTESREYFYLETLDICKKANLPVLIINGGLDTANDMTLAYKERSGAQLHVVKGANHEEVFSKRHLQEVIDSLNSFLKS